MFSIMSTGCHLTVLCVLSLGNPRAIQRLKDVMATSSLNQNVSFQRADFEDILEDHTLSMIRHRECSSSLLAFCGSKHVSAAVEKAKIQHDLTVAMSGYKRHQIEYISECNGSPKIGKYGSLSEGDRTVASADDGSDGSHITHKQPRHMIENVHCDVQASVSISMDELSQMSRSAEYAVTKFEENRQSVPQDAFAHLTSSADEYFFDQ